MNLKMKKFNFRLQKLLDFRKWREKSSQQVLAAAQRERENARQELERKIQEVEVQNQNSLDQVSKGIKAGDALAGSLYSQRLQKEANLKERKVQECDVTVIEKREELIEVSREKRAIEKLREKRQSEYIQETSRKQQTVLDDDAVRRHHTEMKANGRNGS